jgi:hypothetical protein
MTQDKLALQKKWGTDPRVFATSSVPSLQNIK